MQMQNADANADANADVQNANSPVAVEAGMSKPIDHRSSILAYSSPLVCLGISA